MSRELEYWRDHRRSEEILIAPTGGEIVWDAQFGGFDWESHNGVADNTQRSLQSEPLFVDLRGLQANEVVLDESKVRDIGRLLCGCNHGQSLPDIVGEDVRQHRRIRRLALVMVLLFFSLLIALLISLYALFRLKGQP